MIETVELRVIEGVELAPPPNAELLRWRLLTTHEVEDAVSARQAVTWHKSRCTIEQLFRILKTQGLQIESRRVETAGRLLKLTAIAAKAAVIALQLAQARDGESAEPASIAFEEDEIRLLDALGHPYEGRTKLQGTPCPPRSLAWAAWIIARLGGWDRYPRTKARRTTIHRGLADFLRVAQAVRQLENA